METPNTKINEKERKVLEHLSKDWHRDEWGAYSFAPLMKLTGLELKEVRRACRSLKKKGLAEFERTLFDADGIPAGAGYRATEAGAALFNPCDICGKFATYDYEVDENGEYSWKAHGRRVRECEEHYEQSAKKPQATALAL